MHTTLRTLVATVLVAATTLLPASPAMSAAPTGTLTAAGCIADAGHPHAPDCDATTAGLDGAHSVVVSPDGTSLYAVSYNDDAVLTFARNPATGALTPAGCITSTEDPHGTGCGATTPGLYGARTVAVSPDGTSVYVTSYLDNAVVTFARNTVTGALTPAGCISAAPFGPDVAPCDDMSDALIGAWSAAVSPDGSSVYVVSADIEALVTLIRNPSTGALTPAGCVSFDPSYCGDSAAGLNGVISATVSPDGKSVYAVSTDTSAIVSFTRNPSNGALTPAGCITDTGDPHGTGCGTTSAGLDSPLAVTVSPDGTSVYVASFVDDAIVSFTRNRNTGTLAPAGCIGDTAGPTGASCSSSQGLDGAASVTVSPDSKSVFVASYGDDAIASFIRNPNTGALTSAGCISDSRGGLTCPATTAGLNGPYSVAASPDGTSVYAASLEADAIVSFQRVGDPSNHTLIRLPGTGTSGPGVPSPSTITVQGLESKVADVNVTLHGLSHTSLADLDILLQGPSGQAVMLLSDAGGGEPGVSQVDLTFDDRAAHQIVAAPATGSYRPTNVAQAGEVESFPAHCNPGPDPASPKARCLTTAFRGTNPNGTWKLYLIDDESGHSGLLARGWSLDITTDIAVTGRVTAAKKQKTKNPKAKIKITSTEPLTAVITGKVKLGKKSYKLKSLTESLGAGSKTLKLKPAKAKHTKLLARALAKGKKLKATITIVLTDDLGNVKTQRLKVTLKPKA